MSEFLNIYLGALALLVVVTILLWILSIPLKNVSIIDSFWGPGFVLAVHYYFSQTDGVPERKYLIAALTTIWGLRLGIYLLWRNWGEGEDYRYVVFRNKYGNRYWWVSLFQVFLLQAVLIWLISAPLLGAQYYRDDPLGWLDFAGVGVWLIGFFFEVGSDWQLARFKSDPANKGKLLTTGFWRYTRHPNYFGDSAVWWGYGLICMAGGSYVPVLGSVLTTAMIIKFSGADMLESFFRKSKPGFEEYARKTNKFIPWFPRE